jgi:membrane fusion protein, multidrug efflux system
VGLLEYPERRRGADTDEGLWEIVMEWPFQFLKEVAGGNASARRAKLPSSTLLRAGLVLGLAVVAVILFIIVKGLLAPGAGHANPPVPVMEAMAEAKAVPVQVTTIGHVEPINTVALRTRVEGQIAEVAVTEGQAVKTGDTLFQLDDRQARAALDQAVAALTRDQAQLDYARKQVERQKSLSKNNVVSRSQFDQAVSTADALAGTVESDKAQIANAQTLLSFTTITAPIDGRIGGISVKTGNTVQTGSSTPLVTINQIAPIYVRFSVPQDNLAALRDAVKAGPVPVTAEPTGEKQPPSLGSIAFYDNAIDPATGTLAVRAVFPNEDERLWPGQFAEVVVTLSIEKDVVTVPSTAVKMGQNGSYLFVIKPDNTVEMRPVTVSRTVGLESVIAEGLKSGEPVVTSGQLRLIPGSHVKIVKNAETTAPGAGS